MSAQVRKDLEHVMNVAQIRHRVDDALLPRQQRGRQNGECRIFGAADFNEA